MWMSGGRVLQAEGDSTSKGPEAGAGGHVYGPARRLSGRSRVSEGVGIEELMEVGGEQLGSHQAFGLYAK